MRSLESARSRTSQAHSTQRPTNRAAIGAQRGDTLIEVLVGALLLAVIVVATLSGLDSTNRSTTLQRSRSQADALAQQNEDQLRSEPIATLAQLEAKPETKTVTENGTVFTVTTTAAYIDDTTATSSCSLASNKAAYLQTTSTVTWASLGPGKPVVESGIISPPAGSAVIIQVSESGTPLAGATATVTGPLPEGTVRSLETSSSGCATIAVPPGEYNLNVSKPGYVDPNGYENTFEDKGASTAHTVYIPAETTSKDAFFLGKAAGLNISFTGGGGEGDTAVAFNTGMSAPKVFGSLGKYTALLKSAPEKMYPFPSRYNVYAGTCESDAPINNGQAKNQEVLLSPGGIAPVTVAQPEVHVQIFKSKSGTPEEYLPEGSLVRVEDQGCGTERKLQLSKTGTLKRAGLPYGKYSLCVVGAIKGGETRKLTYAFANNTPEGTPVKKLYLPEGNKEKTCP